MNRQSLNGRWQFRRADEDKTTWKPATVPGCVHMDLLDNEMIPDPYYRDNELQVMWVGETDWVYQHTFAVDDELLNQAVVLLRCEGLDTLATLVLNGTEIGKVDNQFRTWEFDAKPHLVTGENVLEIRFDSALLYGQKRLNERYIHSWSTDAHKLPGGNYVRKSQCNFGWDWGPKLVTCGVWRDIELVGFDHGRLSTPQILQDHSQAGQVSLTTNISVERVAEAPLLAQVEVSLDGTTVGSDIVAVEGNTAVSQLTIQDPNLWWPNGLGEQPLYTVRVTLLDEEKRPLDNWQRHIGLRTLELVREKDQWGESFHFACNGVPFFAKGANWIPADTFINRITDDWYEDLLQSSADAHMNMMRVWGGGIYEQTVFYDLCDKLGICVWQDFMYACATYPTFEDEFMANAKQEAIENIERLRHHASLALWCGNNELEQGLVQETWTPTAMSWEDYGRLFDELLPELVADLDPQTSYWPGSPHTPEGDRHVWNDPNSGDAHIWDVWHGLKPFEFFYTCFHRFNSEFGFQSFPEPQVVHGFTKPEDRNITNFIMEHHQRSPSGNSRIMHYMLDWFQIPPTFDMTLWLSQILQGMSIKHAVEHWRRTMPRGMGTLYWQLNDCWPIASWSSLDHEGRWKALHYMSRHFFAPLMLSAVPDWDSGRVPIHVTNDRLETVEGVVKWEVTTAQGELIESGAETAVIQPNQNNKITMLELYPLLKSHGARDLLVWLSLEVDGDVVSTNLALFCRPKHLKTSRPEIMWDVVDGGNGRYQITLTSDKPALWTWLEVLGERVNLSDNFFHLQANKPFTITLTERGHTTSIDDIKNSITVYSLFDTYQEAHIK